MILLDGTVLLVTHDHDLIAATRVDTDAVDGPGPPRGLRVGIAEAGGVERVLDFPRTLPGYGFAGLRE